MASFNFTADNYSIGISSNTPQTVTFNLTGGICPTGTIFNGTACASFATIIPDGKAVPVNVDTEVYVFAVNIPKLANPYKSANVSVSAGLQICFNYNAVPVKGGKCDYEGPNFSVP
jgi:hypothetical protein